VKRDEFLEQLREKMKSLAVSEEEIGAHIGRFEAYFAPMDEDAAVQAIEAMGGIEGVLTSLEAFYGIEGSDEEASDYALKEESDIPLESDESSEDSEEEKTAERTLVFDEKSVEEALPQQETKRGASFWTLFVVTLPLTLSLYVAMTLLFLSAFTALVSIAAAFGLSSVLTAAAGTALSLVGVVYGAFRLFTYLPIGLYELGIGLVLFGITLVLSILFYNLAVRLFPFIIGRLAKLYGNINRRLFDALKGGGRV